MMRQWEGKPQRWVEFVVQAFELLRCIITVPLKILCCHLSFVLLSLMANIQLNHWTKAKRSHCLFACPNFWTNLICVSFLEQPRLRKGERQHNLMEIRNFVCWVSRFSFFNLEMNRPDVVTLHRVAHFSSNISMGRKGKTWRWIWSWERI